MKFGSTPKGFDAMQFKDAFARYLSAPSGLPPKGNGPLEANTGKTSEVADLLDVSHLLNVARCV